jgi:putative transposase
MVYDPNVHHRRSVRLRTYDYSQRGAYFVTLCTHGWIPWFGKIEQSEDGGAKVLLNACGTLMQDEWLGMAERFGVEIDNFVIMPNHLHALLVLPGSTVSLAQVVGAYKSLTSLAYGHRVRNDNWPSYEQRFWHRNYYEHIIRDQADLDRIRLYIADNPARWADDNLDPSQPHHPNTP